MAEEEPKKKTGPKGGKKHQPGRDHDSKSARSRKKRFARKAARKRRQQDEDARKAWEAWDALPDEVKQLLGPSAQPQMPRPSDE